MTNSSNERENKKFQVLKSKEYTHDDDDDDKIAVVNGFVIYIYICT